jgi:hypothetical protein
MKANWASISWSCAQGQIFFLYIEELYDLCFSPNIIRVIKSRRRRISQDGGGQKGYIQDLDGDTLWKETNMNT